MILSKHDTIVHAWAEYVSGPGWSNQIVRVVVCDGNQKSRVETLQARECGPEVNALLEFSDLAHRQMTGAVMRSKAVKRGRGGQG